MRLGALSWRIFFGLMGLMAQCSAIFEELTLTGEPEYCTLFHHNVKAGGTSIRDQLILSRSSDDYPEPGLCTNGQKNVDECLRALHHSEIIVGYVEMMRRPLEDIGRECEYFTMMRHPIDRLVSAFFYCPEDHDIQDRPDKWCGGRAHDQPLAGRLVDFAKHYWGNKYLRQMGWSRTCPEESFCSDDKGPDEAGSVVQEQSPKSLFEPGAWEWLEYSQSILKSYTAVGIMEHWNLSMELFDARVTSSVKSWNVNYHANSNHEEDFERAELARWAKLSPEINAIMSADLLIYAYALTLFKYQTEDALGTDWSGGSPV